MLLGPDLWIGVIADNLQDDGMLIVENTWLNNAKNIAAVSSKVA